MAILASDRRLMVIIASLRMMVSSHDSSTQDRMSVNQAVETINRISATRPAVRSHERKSNFITV
jgi:hypothetical protein